MSSGVDFSTNWARSFHTSRDHISKRLHLLHPSHLAFLDMCQNPPREDSAFKCMGQMLLVDFSKLKAQGPMDQHQLRNNITIELEKTQDYIRNIWYTNFINLFVDKSRFRPVPDHQIQSFYSSVAILASNQVIQIISKDYGLLIRFK